MTPITGFLQSILASPDDETPLLIFADWLEEQDDPILAARGELMRLQCELGGWVPDCERRSELQARERRLLNLRGPWIGALQRHCKDCRFERGLVNITMEARRFVSKTFAEQARDLFSQAWVQRVRVEDVSESLVGALANAAHLDAVSQLDLNGAGLEDVDWLPLMKSGHLRNLSRLDLGNNQLTDRSLQHLMSLSHLAWLDLRNNDIRGSGLWPLFTADAPPGLTWLDLQGNDLDPMASQALFTWRQQKLIAMPAGGGRSGKLPKRFLNSIGMELVLIPAGSFWMGTPETEKGRSADEGPMHEVTLSRPCYFGVFAVTQGQYEAVMGVNPSRFHRGANGGPDHPVDRVAWTKAGEFCRRLSDLPEEAEHGRKYRLPTEAEWEYACRAGDCSSPAFYFGDTVSSRLANFDGSFPFGGADAGPFLERTTRVGSYPPNGWGLYDMHGNVWNWCSDWYGADYYQKSPACDPQGPDHGEFRILRGGAWYFDGRICRSGYRCSHTTDDGNERMGFRVVMTLPD
jgi:uncharacterized protein (TIGR02996 family)